MQSTVTFDLGTTNPDSKLGAEVWLNDQQWLNCDHVIEPIPVKITVDDSNAEHELKIVLKHKTINHTTVDHTGNIVQDSCVTVNNFKFDDIEVDQLVSEQAVYRHSFNSDQLAIEDKFYWNLGCNGTVTIKFQTPMYIWLLENM